MKTLFRPWWLFALVYGFSAPLFAAPTLEAMQSVLQRFDPRLQIADISSTPMSGLYQIKLSSGQLLYTDAQGEFLLLGDLLQITETGLVDLTDLAQADERRVAMDQVPSDEKITFAASGEERAVVRVFTDISCPYCVQLHDQMADFNQQGITVEYLAMPRQGPGSRAFQQLVNIWCADQPAQALDQAMAGGRVRDQACEHPVTRHAQLAQRLRIQGTPATLLPDGQLVFGMVDVQTLLGHLNLNPR